jgi:hypothetical protein
VREPLVKFEFIRMPDSTGFGDYTVSLRYRIGKTTTRLATKIVAELAFNNRTRMCQDYIFDVYRICFFSKLLDARRARYQDRAIHFLALTDLYSVGKN